MKKKRFFHWFVSSAFKPALRQAKLLFQKLAALSRYVKLLGATALLLIIIPLGLAYHHHQLYTVSSVSRQLLSRSSVDTSKVKLTSKTIGYDAADQKSTNEKSVTIAGPTDATGKTGYKASIDKDFSKGLSFGDSNGELSFRLTPLFSASKARYQNGQTMFPVSASTKIFQTFKKNGIKEDIILTGAPARIAKWQWKLELGDKMVARMLPDGSVGIFAANPNLYGNVQINDAKSQELINKARTTNKNYLIFAIPAPYIKDAQGKTFKEDVSYKLEGDTLTLEATNLKNQHYPVSIDPSVVVTTTADFATGSDDGMINYSTANQIGRSTVSLGSVGATSQQTGAFTTARSGHTSVAYNGYLYVIGGTNGTAQNDIQFATVNSDGSLSCPSGFTCSGGTVFAVQTNAFTTARKFHTSVAYNGYLHIVGGCTDALCTTILNDIQHCPLNSNGSVGTCVQQTNAFTTARSAHTSVAYNGYLYVIGGCTAYGLGCNSSANDIQHCPINADGSVGTCVQQTNAFTTARNSHTSVAYNGYLYVIGGSGGGDQNDIIHCPINADGSVGTCVRQTSAFTTARSGHTSVAYNGYLYVVGGFGGSDQNDIQHCPINADGSVGTCVQEAAAFTTARSGHTSVAYNGYLYVIGGFGGSYQNDAQRLLVDTGTPTGMGAVGATSQQTNAFTTARNGHTSIAYNGYLYIVGGCSDTGTCSVFENDILHCPINADGSVGTCVQQTNAFTTGRNGHTSVAYNGYLYVIGGYNGSYQNDIQHCPLNADGSVGTCVQQTNAFTTARTQHTSVAYNGYLYVIGGNSGSDQNDIQHCPLNADGSVGTCVQQTNAFTTARRIHTSVAYNGYLYVIGGNAAAAAQNDIIHCPINSGGDVGTCIQQTNAFTTARWGHTSVAYNGYLYVIGGLGGSYQNDIQHLPINADGSVGATVSQAAAFTTARTQQTSVAYNGYLYVIGGYNGSNQNDIQHLSISSMAQAAHYERVIDIGKTADSLDSIQYNGTAKCGTEIQYSTGDSAGVFGSLNTLTPDAVAGTTYTISGQNLKRYIRVVITLTDQSCGGTSSVTDVTVNYTVLPPAAPTLSAPASGAIGLSSTPTFQLKTTDAADSYAQYKILVYQSDCSTLVRTIDQTSSQTGWSGQDAQTSTAYVVGATLGASTLASHTYQSAGLSYGTTYCWKAAAIDPGGSNTFGSYSATQTFTTNQSPATPQLEVPASSASGVSVSPQFRLRSTDPDSDYLQYFLQIYDATACGGSLVRTIDQTSSQTGWQGQDAQTSTAYKGAVTIGNSTVAAHNYQSPPLAPNHLYSWRAKAIDPGGTNTFSSLTSCRDFTTATSEVQIRGGVEIRGGTTIQ